MKKNYAKPEINVIELGMLDVITTSGIDAGGRGQIPTNRGAKSESAGYDWSMFKTY